MSEEKRKTNKIVPMPTAMNDQEQDQVDSLILERLDREADALEEELNNDPTLAGVSLSRDFLNVIIGKLKEEGLWDEEDEEMAENEDGEERNGKEKNGVIESNQDRERNGEIEKNIERNRKSKECEEQQESRDGKRSEAEVGDKEEKEREDRERCVEAGDKEGQSKIAETVDQSTSVEIMDEKRNEKSGKEKHRKERNGKEKNREIESKKAREECGEIEGKAEKGNLEEINDLKSQNSKENGVSMTQEDLDRLYQMLPEQDRRAMEMGRQVEKKKEKRRRRVKKWGMPVGVAASLMVLVCGMGMSSEANKEWLRQTGAVILKNLGFNISVEFTDEENIIYSKSAMEQEALKNIKEKMNLPAPCFINVPDGFEFLQYEIMFDESEATMLYSYQDRIITVNIYKIVDEGVIYTGLDDSAVLRDTLENSQKAIIKIWETNLDISVESYLAEVEHKDGYYVINSAIPLDEMKKLVKSVFFL